MEVRKLDKLSPEKRSVPALASASYMPIVTSVLQGWISHRRARPTRAAVASAERACVLECNVPATRRRAESRGLTWARSVRGGGTIGDGLVIHDGALAGSGASLPLDAGGAEGSRTPDPLYAKQVLYH